MPKCRYFAHFDLQMCFVPQRRAIFRHLNFKKWSEPDMFCTFLLENVLLATAACDFSTSQLQKVVRALQFLTFWLENVLLATAACNFSTSQLQKVVRARQFFNILTWKCASRYSGVQFFNISTSKSGPNLTCFVHFDLKMCFSLKRRAIFQHLNFKKWCEPDMFCTFWLEHVLLATAACNFSTSQLQKVIRTWHVLCIFT